MLDSLPSNELQNIGGIKTLRRHIKDSLMARVTVEDCIDKVSNRFELVLLAAHRARMISGGLEPSLDRDNDKNPVLALREIAVETVTFDELMESTIESHQRQIEVDEPDDEDLSLLIGEGQKSKEDNIDEAANEDLLQSSDGCSNVRGQIEYLATLMTR